MRSRVVEFDLNDPGKPSGQNLQHKENPVGDKTCVIVILIWMIKGNLLGKTCNSSSLNLDLKALSPSCEHAGDDLVITGLGELAILYL